MANQHKEKQRCVRGIPQDTWDRFEAETDAAGTTRSDVVHAFIRWWLGEPDAELPERPSAA